MVIRTVIVDDEELAREGIRVRLKDEADVEIVGEAGDGPSAVKMIRNLTPDLIFLDVQMPTFDGLEVVRRLGAEPLPAIVFVTAHDRYAIKAFEANAIDYLRKPVTTKRFQQTLRRVRLDLAKDMALRLTDRRLLNLLQADRSTADRPQAPEGQAAFMPRLAVRDRDRFVIVNTADIDWVDSAANYVQLHVKGRVLLLRATMNELEEQLDPRIFARIHRTVIVKIDRVREVLPSENGDFSVILQDGTHLRLSRTYRDRLFSHVYPNRKGESA
jgi:two-component system LytT family response regulator